MLSFVNLTLKDVAETLLTGIFGAIASRFVFGQNFVGADTFNMFPLTLLNDLDTIYLYGLVFALSSVIGNVTGDFVLPWISGQTYFRDIRKISSPVSMGLISVGLLFLLNGFSISLYPGLYAFGIGAGSNIAAQWASDRIPTSGNPLLKNYMAPQPIAQSQQSIVSPPPRTNTMGGFGGMGDLNSFLGFGGLY